MSAPDTLDVVADDAWKELLLDLLPSQGEWSEDAYLWLTDHTTRLVELTDGRLDVLPMPTDAHQSIVQAAFLAFYAFLGPLGGKVQFAPLRLRINDGRIREPDLLLIKDAGDPRRQNRFWTGADLVLEVVSPDRPERDREEKPVDYAALGVPEYWIVDPLAATVSVLTLDGSHYRATVYSRGQRVVSRILNGFSIESDSLLDAK